METLPHPAQNCLLINTDDEALDGLTRFVKESLVFLSSSPDLLKPKCECGLSCEVINPNSKHNAEAGKARHHILICQIVWPAHK